MEKKQWSGLLACFFAALFWGIAFVAQDMAMEHMGSFTFQAVRSYVGALALIPVFTLRTAIAKRKGLYVPPTRAQKRKTLFGGILCGTVLCVASCLQQFGIANNTTSPGKDAFITALYLVFVPVLGLFLGKRPSLRIWLCVLAAIGGLWLLCMAGGAALTVGDIQLIACSIIFAVHILIVDALAPGLDGAWLSCVQFLTLAVICTALMFIFEEPTLAGILAGWFPILFAGVFSCGVAYTLQIVGQQRLAPTAASLVLSLESVFAVIASAVLLGMMPSVREFLGMAVIFGAIVVSELPTRVKKSGKNSD